MASDVQEGTKHLWWWSLLKNKCDVLNYHTIQRENDYHKKHYVRTQVARLWYTVFNQPALVLINNSQIICNDEQTVISQIWRESTIILQVDCFGGDHDFTNSPQLVPKKKKKGNNIFLWDRLQKYDQCLLAKEGQKIAKSEIWYGNVKTVCPSTTTGYHQTILKNNVIQVQWVYPPRNNPPKNIVVPVPAKNLCTFWPYCWACAIFHWPNLQFRPTNYLGLIGNHSKKKHQLLLFSHHQNN